MHRPPQLLVKVNLNFGVSEFQWNGSMTIIFNVVLFHSNLPIVPKFCKFSRFWFFFCFFFLLRFFSFLFTWLEPSYFVQFKQKMRPDFETHVRAKILRPTKKAINKNFVSFYFKKVPILSSGQDLIMKIYHRITLKIRLWIFHCSSHVTILNQKKTLEIQ